VSTGEKEPQVPTLRSGRDDKRLLFSNYCHWKDRPPFVISTEA
jgi:hypothetical protein